MTLIALRVHDDHAEVLVDTLTYSLGEATFRHCSKAHVLPHADLVLMGKGPFELGAAWRFLVDSSPDLASIDDLDQLARDALPLAWADLEDLHGTRAEAWLYAVGWSPSRARFVATEYSSARGFAPHDLTGPDVVTNPAVTDAAAPTDDAGWLALGEAAYLEHSVTLGGGKTMIGGTLILTRLERGASSQRTLARLPEDDWRYRQMMIGTLHRFGQIGPCLCGSAQPAAVCHLLGADEPCPCSSGQTFDPCHRVDPHTPEVFAYWAAHAEDFHRTAPQLREAWLRAFPDGPEITPPQIIPSPTGPAADHPVRLAPQGPAAVLQSRHELREAARRKANPKPRST